MPGFNYSRQTADGRAFYCAAVGCQDKCSRRAAAEMFCAKHWRMVPSDVQKMVERTYRAEFTKPIRWSARFERAMEWAVSECWSVQTSGTRIPRESEFEF